MVDWYKFLSGYFISIIVRVVIVSGIIYLKLWYSEWLVIFLSKGFMIKVFVKKYYKV